MLETEGNLWLKCKMGPVTSCKWDEITRISRVIYLITNQYKPIYTGYNDV